MRTHPLVTFLVTSASTERESLPNAHQLGWMDWPACPPSTGITVHTSVLSSFDGFWEVNPDPGDCKVMTLLT